MSWRQRACRGVLVLGVVLYAGGCVVYKAAKTTGELAATTVIVAGKTAGVVVKTTGHVASSTITSTGALTVSGIEALAELAQAGMVTLVDAATGVIVRVPWAQGMTLYTAGETAELTVAGRAVDLVRQGRLIYKESRHTRGGPVLEPGDVVRLARPR